MPDDRDIHWINRHYRSGLPFAMISASRNSNTATQNRASTNELQSELSKYNPIRTIGKGHERDKNGAEVPCMETSFFVPYHGKNFAAFKRHMQEQAARYGQEWVMIGNGKVVTGYADGQPVSTFNHLVLNVDDAKDIWSKIKGKNFAFREGLTTAGELLERLEYSELNAVGEYPKRKALFIAYGGNKNGFMRIDGE